MSKLKIDSHWIFSSDFLPSNIWFSSNPFVQEALKSDISNPDWDNEVFTLPIKSVHAKELFR